MANFATISKNLGKFDFNKVISSYLSSKSVKDAIISQIKGRLFRDGLQKKGINVDTDRGSPYTSFTIKQKKARNQKTNVVTLHDSGSLYNSMVTIVTDTQLQLVADFDNKIYLPVGIFKNFTKTFSSKKEFREAVMSLTDNEIDNLINSLFLKIIDKMKKEI